MIKRLEPPVKYKLKTQYFDRYSESFKDAKVLSSIGDQSRPVQTGRCYSADGTDDHILTPFSADYLMTNYGIEGINLDSQKVGFMGKIPSTEGDGIIAFFGNVGACLYQGSLRIASNLGTDYVGTVHNSSDLRDDQWHEFMFEFDYITNTHKAYVDGELYFETTYNSYSTSAYRFSFAPTYIFVRNSDLAGSIEMEMFDLKIYFNDELKAWYKMDEGSGTACYDSSGNDNHSTIVNATLETFHSTQDIYSWQNEVGYSIDELNYPSILIPAKNENLDIFDNSLTYKGQVAYNALLKQSNCLNLDGIDDEIIFTDVTGWESVEHQGTSVLTLDQVNKKITATAGTVFDLKVLDISGNTIAHYPISEGAGTKIHDTISGNHGELKNASIDTVWDTQDVYHYNIQNGYSIGVNNEFIPASLTNHNKDAAGNELDFIAGRHHNGAETQIDFSGGVASPFAKNLPIDYKYGDSIDYKEVSDNKESDLLIYEEPSTEEIIKINNYIKKQ